MHHKISPTGKGILVRWDFKSPMYDFKNYFFPDFVIFKECNIFFPEICFANTISELKFTVCAIFIALNQTVMKDIESFSRILI